MTDTPKVPDINALIERLRDIQKGMEAWVGDSLPLLLDEAADALEVARQLQIENAELRFGIDNLRHLVYSDKKELQAELADIVDENKRLKETYEFQQGRISDLDGKLAEEKRKREQIEKWAREQPNIVISHGKDGGIEKLSFRYVGCTNIERTFVPEDKFEAAREVAMEDSSHYEVCGGPSQNCICSEAVAEEIDAAIEAKLKEKANEGQ